MFVVRVTLVWSFFKLVDLGTVPRGVAVAADRSPICCVLHTWGVATMRTMLGAISGTKGALTLLACCLLAGCASHACPSSVTCDISISAESAVQLLRQGKIKLIDTRAPSERSAGSILGSLPIQFGSDRWTDSVTDQDKTRFLAQVTAAGLNQHESIVTICNAGVRSLAAAKILRSAGYTNVRSVLGGYLGTDSDPGWQFFE